MQTQMVHEPDWRRRKRLQRWASSALLFAVAGDLSHPAGVDAFIFA